MFFTEKGRVFSWWKIATYTWFWKVFFTQEGTCFFLGKKSSQVLDFERCFLPQTPFKITYLWRLFTKKKTHAFLVKNIFQNHVRNFERLFFTNKKRVFFLVKHQRGHVIECQFSIYFTGINTPIPGNLYIVLYLSYPNDSTKQIYMLFCCFSDTIVNVYISLIFFTRNSLCNYFY